MDKSQLESLITSDKEIIALASLAVAVGLVGEYWEKVAEIISLYWSSYPLNIALLRKIGKLASKLIFPAIVVGGVAVEWMFEADVSVHEAQYAHALDTENDEIKREAAKAIEGAAEANKDAAVLKNDAAQARLERERLKLQAQWRELPEASASKLLAALSSIPATVPRSVMPGSLMPDEPRDGDADQRADP